MVLIVMALCCKFANFLERIARSLARPYVDHHRSMSPRSGDLNVKQGELFAFVGPRPDQKKGLQINPRCSEELPYKASCTEANQTIPKPN